MEAMKKYNESMEAIRKYSEGKKGEVKLAYMVNTMDLLLFQIALECPEAGKVFDKFLKKS